MTRAAFASLLLRQPFQPFTVHISGDQFGVDVDRPEQVHSEPGDRIVRIESGSHEYVIDLDLVVMIQIKPLKGGR
jgi:hypothetical protein